MEKIKLFEAFAGYGSQAMALKRLNVPFEHVGISEIDKYAIQAHKAVHGDVKNYGDITKINWCLVPDFNLFTYSFPCQDISTAGMCKGLAENSGTRSSLLWECRKAIAIKRPKYLLLENVKALTNQKNMPYLKLWEKELFEMGYQSYMKVLNARDFGVPQNRERVFLVSILGDEYFCFPEPVKLTLRIKDILEKDVNESYYVKKDCKPGLQEPQVLRAERTEYGKAKRKEYESGKLKCSRHELTEMRPRKDGVSNTITTVLKDNLLCEPIGRAMRGRNPINPSNREKAIHTEQHIELGKNIANCLTTVQKDSLVIIPGNRTDGVYNYRIRKLTEKECFRLMGVSDDDIDKIQKSGVCRTQQYRMAGNSIVVNVLCEIFRKLLIEKKRNSNSLF